MFEVCSSKKIFHANDIAEISEKQINNSLPYIVRTTQNNWLRWYIIEDELYANDWNTLSFAQDTFSVFYQKQNYFTWNKVKVLKPKFKNNNEVILQYITACFQKTLNTLTWWIGSTVETIKEIKIQLPTKNGEIDFEFMEDFIEELEWVKIQKLDSYLEETGLKDCELTQEEAQVLRDFESGKFEWGEFKYNDFFELKIIQNKLSKSDLDISGSIPIYSSDSSNNWIIWHTKRKAEFTISCLNEIYIVFWDHTRMMNIAMEDFSVADNVKVLSSKKAHNLKDLFFILSSWKKNIPNKWYSRHWSIAKDTFFSIPTKNNHPDYELMETLISAVQKLVVRDMVKYVGERV